MKYLRTDILAGSEKSDQAQFDKLMTKFDEHQNKMLEIHLQAQADWVTILARVEEAPDNWAPTQAELKQLVGVEHNNATLGMSTWDLDNLKSDIDRLRDKIDNFKPSELTMFLRSIEDTYVTDSGIRTAGITHNGLGRYLVLAKEG